MRIVDLSQSPLLPMVADTIRGLTGARDSAELMGGFLSRYSRLRPVQLFVGVQRVDEGAYRVLYTLDATQCHGRLDLERFRADAARRPLQHGGIIPELVQGELPRLAVDLRVENDPALGSSVRGYTRCLALPILGEGREWVLGFSNVQQPPDPDQIAQAMMTANLVGLADRNLRSLREISTLNTRLNDQFEQIARLQQALLPGRIPEIPGLEIATSYLTSDQAGGDYYDFFELPAGRWGILIADVSGHGAAAATVTAMLHAILHSHRSLGTTDGADPAGIMRFANSRLAASGMDGSFVTAFFAVYNPRDASLTYASCGHNPPRLLRAGGEIRALDEAATFPLGIDAGMEVTTARADLAPGDTLLLYTDGITELFGGDRELFGVERLDATLRTTQGGPDEVVDAVHRALYAHRGAATRDDDQTLVAVRHHGLCAL